MSELRLLLTLISLISLATLFTAYFCVLWHLRAPVKNGVDQGVSILKPLKGIDDGLLDNLRSIAQQQHDNFEIIFGAEDPMDPALQVARQVQAEFPTVPIRVISGAFVEGLNPKVRVLRHLLPFAKYEWILISDSNVRPGVDYLRAMQAKQQQEGADLVHSVLSGQGGKSWGGRLEELQLNGWVAASICFSDSFGHSCVIGKSMLLRRTALNEVGGFGDVADILAEDYILGSRLQKAGRKVVLSPYRLTVMTGKSGMQHFFNRHVRWGQMRRRISPGFFFAELTANPTPFLLALIAVSDGSLQNMAVFAQLGKWSLDAVVYLRLARIASFQTLWLMPIKDLLVPVMWALSAVRRTVNWRGNLMWVGPGSRLYPVHEHDRAAWNREASQVQHIEV